MWTVSLTVELKLRFWRFCGRGHAGASGIVRPTQHPEGVTFDADQKDRSLWRQGNLASFEVVKELCARG